MIAWLLLCLAGLLEVGWAVGLKYTDGFTRPIWTGVGTVGTAVLGIVLLGEAATVARLACIGLIVTGIAGLRLVSPE